MSEEFPAELVERCREAVAKAAPDYTRFWPYDWVVCAVLRASGYAELVAALRKARPFVETLALRPSSYWIVEREKIVRECAAIAAKEAVKAYDVDSRDEARLISDRIDALIETPTNPIEGAAMRKLAEEALAQIDAALEPSRRREMTEPTFEDAQAWREQAQFWEDQAASIRKQNAELAAALEEIASDLEAEARLVRAALEAHGVGIGSAAAGHGS